MDKKTLTGLCRKVFTASDPAAALADLLAPLFERHHEPQEIRPRVISVLLDYDLIAPTDEEDGRVLTALCIHTDDVGPVMAFEATIPSTIGE